MQRTVALALLLGVLAGGRAWLASGRAWASPFDIYGTGSTPLAMVGAYVAHSGDVHAAFYNPAGLARLRRFELTVSTLVALPSLGLKLDGKPFNPDYLGIDRSQNPPVVVLRPDGQRDVDFTAQDVERAGGIVFGVAGPLGPSGTFLGRFAFGTLVYLPFSQVLRERFGRAEDPFFLDYEDRALRLMMVLGGAFELIRDVLSVGLAINILSDSDAVLETVPTPSTRVDLVGRVAVNAGILYSPLPNLRLGFCFRDHLALTAHAAVRPLVAQQGLEIETINPISRDAEVTVQTLFSPRVYTLGAGYDWNARFTTTVELSVVDWTSYRPPFAPPMDVHQVGAPQNLCVARNNECIRNQPREVAAIQSTMVKLSPVVIPRVAARWQSSFGMHVAGGYAFVPTPVADQTSITSILDANKHVFGLGGGYLRAFGKGTLRAELGLQLQVMQTRRFRKDVNDPLIGAYSTAASGVDRDASFAPNPLSTDYPRTAPEVEFWGISLALGLTLAYSYSL